MDVGDTRHTAALTAAVGMRQQGVTAVVVAGAAGAYVRICWYRCDMQTGDQVLRSICVALGRGGSGNVAACAGGMQQMFRLDIWLDLGRQ